MNTTREFIKTNSKGNRFIFRTTKNDDGVVISMSEVNYPERETWQAAVLINELDAIVSVLTDKGIEILNCTGDTPISFQDLLDDGQDLRYLKLEGEWDIVINNFDSELELWLVGYEGAVKYASIEFDECGMNIQTYGRLKNII